MSSQPHEDIIVDQSLEDLLPIVITEYDAISRKGIQSSFLARDLVRMYDKISFYKHTGTELDLSQYNNITSTTTTTSEQNNIGKDEALVEIIEENQQQESANSTTNQTNVDNLVATNEQETPNIVAESSSNNAKVKTPTDDSSANVPTTPSKEKSIPISSPSSVSSPTKKDVEIIVLPSTEKVEKIDHQRITDFVYNEFEKDEFTRYPHNESSLGDPDRSDQLFVDILNLLTKSFAFKQSVPCHPILSLKEFKEIVVSKAVQNYVSSLLEGKYGDNHPVVKFLTLVDQAFVVSLLGHFAEALFFTKTPIRFKDIRGTWRIDVRLYQDKISMVHRRTEQMLKPLGNTMLKNLFQFSWQVEIIYDSYSLEQIGALHVSLLEVDWASYDESLEMNQKQKDEIQKNFIRMFSKSKADSKLPVRISMVDISMKHVRLLVKELRQQSKKLVKPTSDTSSDNKSWFSSIFTSPESEDDPFTFVSSSKKK